MHGPASTATANISSNRERSEEAAPTFSQSGPSRRITPAAATSSRSAQGTSGDVEPQPVGLDRSGGGSDVDVDQAPVTGGLWGEVAGEHPAAGPGAGWVEAVELVE